MKSWKIFLEEQDEKEEEKTGMDTDLDKEIGEPKKHKNKVLKKHSENLEFFKKRKEGAKKIATQAALKGGPSLLTAWHFAAKDKPYQEVLSAIEANKDEKFFKDKCKNLISKLHVGVMGQKSFQQIMGELEVWGETIEQIYDV